MLKLYLGKAHVICCIIIGSLVQAQGFSTTVVKEGEDAIIECGLQTTVEEGYLRWETMNNGSSVDLAYDIRDGQSSCDDRIIKCTLYANGSIQLESVSKEDAARYYRCLRGDDKGYNYYSDHRLLVLSKESPSISQSPTSVIAFKASRKGIVHSYGEPVCEDDVDGNLPVVCYPPSGVIVDREYETIQCNCTDTDGLMDSVTFPVTKKVSSSPSIETPQRESVSSYNMGKKDVLHGYNAPVCEDDVDGNLPVVCYPPSGVIVDKEYETIQCNCTDSDGQVDSVTFPVTSITHWVHPGWWMASISLLVVTIISISIIVVLIWISPNPCENLKKWKTNRRYEVNSSNIELTDRVAELSPLTEQLEQKEKQETEMKNKLEEQNEQINNIQTQLTEREEEVSNLKDQLEQKEKQETKMKNKLEEQNEQINNSQTELTGREEEVSSLTDQLEQKEKQEIKMRNELEERKDTINNIQTKLTEREREVSNLKDQLEQKEKQGTEMKNKLDQQNEQINNIQTKLTAREAEVSDLKNQLVKKETEMKNKLEEQNEKIIKIEKELAVKEAENNGLEERLKDRQQQITSLEKILADKQASFQQQWDTVVKQGGTKYQEDDNNSEFDKNSSPSEKETKEKGSPRKGKKRDPERKLTLKGNPIVTPQETPEKNNQNDEDVETDSDDSHTTEDNKNLDKDETDFSKSKGCSDDTGPNVSRAFKEYLIDDDSECKGFNLAFTCDGTDMRIELRINEGSDGSICQFEFKNGEIIPSYRGKPEKAIGFKQGTQYDLNLGNHKRVLSLFQRNSAQGNECVKKFEQYDFVLIRLLCIYTSDTSSVSILSHLGLTELPTPVDDLN